MPMKQRKEKGVFYTDDMLAKYMASRLDISEKDKVIDPSCGGGIFIDVILQRLGDKADITNLFAIDIDKEVIKILHNDLKSAGYNEVTVKNNFVASDTINDKNKIFDYITKQGGFDFIIGNPPYVSGKKGENYFPSDLYDNYINGSVNLSMLLTIRSLKLLAKDGVLSFVLPKNLLHVEAYSKLRKEIITEYTILEIVDLGLYFKGVRGEQIVLTVKNSTPNKAHKILVRHLLDKTTFNFHDIEILQSDFENEMKIILFRDLLEKDVVEKIEKNSKNLSDISKNRIFRGVPLVLKETEQLAYRGRDIQKFGLKKAINADPKNPIEYKDKINLLRNKKIIMQNIFSSEAGIIASYVDENYLTTETVTNVIFDSENEAKYTLGLLNSKLLNYYLIFKVFNNSKVTMHTDNSYIGKIPICESKNKKEIVKLVDEALMNNGANIKAITHKIDSIVYSVYNLTDEEIKVVERAIKSVYSKEWW